MYIDIGEQRLLPSLPNIYKHTSNFQALTEDELTGFGVYPIESFYEDDNYRNLLELLGTQYIEYDQITLTGGDEEIGKEVKVTLDKQYFINKINTTKGQTGTYPTIARAINNQPVETKVQASPEEPVITYSDSESYIFLCLGTSTLTVKNESPKTDWSEPDEKNENRITYSLTCGKLDSMPTIAVGDTVSQSNGFQAKVDSIDTASQEVKLIECFQMDRLDKTQSLFINDIEITTDKIFAYDRYRKIKAVSTGEEIVLQGNSELAKEKIVPDILTTIDLNAEPNKLTKIEMTGQDTDMTRERTMNSLGRMV
tara:strand:+ start:99 stop:1031 length:933 start_codon:yes stop_codon:yes gene_type:complete